jgi:nicotinamide-nucleotide amidase
MKAELLMIGSELVSGQKLDTNGQWLARRLGDLGIPVRFTTLLGDDPEDNYQAFRQALGRSDLLITSGGLGPTQDDLTRESLARAAGVELVEDAESLAVIAAFFKRRNRPMTERNRVQALFPQGAEPVANRLGTAPGIWLQAGNCTAVCLPGVPYELKAMFDEEVAPRLRARGLASGVVVHKVVNLFGKGESEVEAMAFDLTARGRVPEVGITASDATISFRVSAQGRDEAEAMVAMEPTLAIIRERFREWIVGEDNVDVTQALVDELQKSRRTLATAESCTGGLIAERLTSIPGVSAVYAGGVVTYWEQSKTALLGVGAEVIARHGVVSGEVARGMAAGVRHALGTDLAISVTGVAGPDGGTEEVPVGRVHVGLATAEGVESKELNMGSDLPRAVIQSRAAKHAMNWARRYLRGEAGMG